MNIYDIVSKDKVFVNYIKQIDKVQESTLPSDHGIKHVMFCVNFVEKFLRNLGEDEKTIDLAKSAAFLHDMGCIYGKDNHVENSVMLACERFKMLNISDEDKKVILDVIANHSSGKQLNHTASAALVLADKCHWSHDRLLKTSKMDSVHRCVASIRNINAEIDKENLIITYYVFSNFSLDDFNEMKKVKFVFPKIAEFYGKKLIVDIVQI